mgnify:CR=1 FL=1
MIKGFYQKEKLTGEIRFELPNIDLLGLPSIQTRNN